MSSQDLTLLSQVRPNYLATLKPDLVNINSEAAQGTIGVSINRISLKQSRFRIIKGGSEVGVIPDVFIDVIMLRSSPVLTKTFYEKQYTPGQEPEAPDCHSEDGIRPAADSKKKQHANCTECPWNQWGSKKNPITGGDIKACSDSKRISITPAHLPEGEPFQISIPGASMKDFGAYMTKLSSVNAPYNAVVTRVSFDTDASYPKLLFAPVRYLTEAEYAIVEARYEEEDVKRTAAIPNSGYSPVAQAAAEAAGLETEDLIPVEQEPVADAWGADAAPQKPAPAEKPAPKKRTTKPKAEAQPEPAAAAEDAWGATPTKPAVQKPAAAEDAWGATKPVQQSAAKPAVKQQPQVQQAASMDDVDDILAGWPDDE